MRAKRLALSVVALTMIASCGSGSDEATDSADPVADAADPAGSAPADADSTDDDAMEEEAPEDEAAGDDTVEDDAPEDEAAGDDTVEDDAPEDDGAESAGPATGEPINIGFQSQERGALAFPQWGAGVNAAVTYINEELGGVDGRPIELDTCVTDGTPEASSACTTELLGGDPVFILNGLDLGNAASHPILDEAGVPYAGALPFTPEDFASPTSLWTGAMIDVIGANPAIARETLGADTAIYMSIDPQIVPAAQTSIDLQTTIAPEIGLELDFVFYNPADTGTFAAAAQQVVSKNPDAVWTQGSDETTTAVVGALLDAGYEGDIIAGTDLTFPQTLGDDSIGVYSASQFYQNPDVAPPEAAEELNIYFEQMEKSFPDVDPNDAFPQAAFASVMGVYTVLLDVGADDITTDSFVEAFREDKDRHLFMSTTFNCATNTTPLTPGICGRGVQAIQWNGEAFDNVGDIVTVVPIIAAG